MEFIVHAASAAAPDKRTDYPVAFIVGQLAFSHLTIVAKAATRHASLRPIDKGGKRCSSLCRYWYRL
jgi:hypothetical protein